MAQAEGYNNTDFLNFPPENKKLWIASTLDALGLAAVKKDPSIGKCVWEWYYKADDLSQKHGQIEAYMNEYPEFMPAQVLLAITEKECGAYIRTKN